MFSDIKGKKIVAELGHNDRLKIYVDPGLLVHLYGFFSESTAPMVLKLHMQHDQTSGIQNDKNSRWSRIQDGRQCSKKQKQ